MKRQDLYFAVPVRGAGERALRFRATRLMGEDPDAAAWAERHTLEQHGTDAVGDDRWSRMTGNGAGPGQVTLSEERLVTMLFAAAESGRQQGLDEARASHDADDNAREALRRRCT